MFTHERTKREKHPPHHDHEDDHGHLRHDHHAHHRGHHRHHPHGHDHHPDHHSHALARHIQELAKMGASQEDLHSIIDQHLTELIAHDVTNNVTHDLGRGTQDKPVDALDRAMAISQACNDVEQAWRSSLRNKKVLVAGEFPPHLLEELLADDIAVTQIHPMHEGNIVPAHFYHLAGYGLRGITSLHDLADIHCDVVLVHGADMGTEVRVSPLVPIVLRMFPDAEKHLLIDDHIAPHMIARIAHNGFRRVSISL